MKTHTQISIYEDLIDSGIDEKYAANLLSRVYFKNSNLSDKKDLLGKMETSYEKSSID